MLPFAEKHLERVIYSHSTSTFLSFLKLIPVTLFTEFTVVKITNDLHVSKSRGQFLALILLDPLSSLDIANHFLEYFFLSWFHKYKHSLRFPYIPELFFLSLLCWLFLSLWCLNLEDLWFFSWLLLFSLSILTHFLGNLIYYFDTQIYNFLHEIRIFHPTVSLKSFLKLFNNNFILIISQTDLLIFSSKTSPNAVFPISVDGNF